MRVNEVHGVIDLDDTCFGWVEWMIDAVGEPPLESGLLSGSIMQMWPNRDKQELLDLVADNRGYYEAMPVPEAAQTLQWMLVNFPYMRISYVSAAPVEAIHDRIRAMSERAFPLPFGENSGVKRVTHVGGHQEKVDWIYNYEGNIDFIIDDSVRYLTAAQDIGVEHRYLISRPWNFSSRGHKRLLSWGHFRSLIVDDLRSMLKIKG